MKQVPIQRQLRAAWPWLLVIVAWFAIVGILIYAAVHFVVKFW